MLGFKQSPVLLQEISRTFHFGYFFESVYYVLNKSEKTSNLTNEDKKILKDAIEFLKNVQKGEEDVKTGSLGGSAVESIGAYRRSLYMFSKTMPRVKFETYILNLIDIIDRLDTSGQLATREMKQLKDFFGGLNIKNFRESEQILDSIYNKRGPIEWTTSY